MLGDRTQATGSFLAKDISVGKKVQITLANAFAGLVRPALTPWGEEPEGTPVSDLPLTFSLGQNYPNPFNPSTQLRYGLPQQSHVTLTIYNTLGQEVARLADEVQAAGYHEVRWEGTNTGGLAVGTGVYFYRMDAVGEDGTRFVRTDKMLLLK